MCDFNSEGIGVINNFTTLDRLLPIPICCHVTSTENNNLLYEEEYHCMWVQLTFSFNYSC